MSTNTVNDVSTAGAEAPLRGWRRRDTVVASVLALIGLAAAVMTFVQVDEFRTNRDRDDARHDAVSAAERVAVALATIHPKDAKADISALADLGTDEFAEQLRSNLTNQVDLIEKNKVSSSGEVRSSGLVRLKGDEAVVAVAVESTVRNKAARKGEQRWYRLTVELRRASSGSWLASEVVFVS